MHSAGVAQGDFEETADERTAIEVLIMNNQDILSNDHNAPAKTCKLQCQITSCATVTSSCQQGMTRSQHVLAWWSWHVLRPSVARIAHARAPGWGGAEAYSLCQQTVKHYSHTVVEWGGRSYSLHTVWRLGEHAVCSALKTRRALPLCKYSWTWC